MFGCNRVEFRVERRIGEVTKTYTLGVPVSMKADEIEGLMILVGMIEPPPLVTVDAPTVATFTRDLRTPPV